MNICLILSSLFSLSFINAYSPLFFSNNKPFSYQKSSLNHLDNQNIKALEKLFYLRNNRYSPYKNIIYLNYKKNNVNITELLENLNKEFLEQNKDMPDDFLKIFNNTHNLIENNINKNNTSKNSRIFGPITLEEIENDKQIQQIDADEEDFPTPFFQIYKQSDSYKNRRNQVHGTSDTDHSFELVKEPTHSFKDIGGYQKIKNELSQVADILRNYQKYQKYNVRTPRGLMLEGPPGNGKTMIAKGFCGEVNSSFISVSGSEFTEKYVGVGASRIRDLFKLAEKNKPCIIFIDEIDALGRKRGNDMVNTNSEKDQTLNQLLISLDGFKDNSGIFVIGATNRVDLLDQALIRPGRIDKKIYIGNPDSETRKEILSIHLEGKPINHLIELESIVDMTGSFSGAQIENLLNEAMLKALRENRSQIEWFDLEYTCNRMLVGWQENENKFSEDMIDRIAVHELGHALVGFLSKDHSSVLKVSLNLWSPTSPGITVFENLDENMNIMTKEGLVSHLSVLLAGRIAEEIFYGYSVTTGAKQDLEKAYELAKNMIIHYGMGTQNIYPDLSDQSKLAIDKEINKLLLESNERAYKIIIDCKDIIRILAVKLKDEKVLKPVDIFNIISKKYNKFIYEDMNNQYIRMLKKNNNNE